MHGKKEVTLFTTVEMMPHTELVHPSTRHNAVNVRMVEQIGTPRMKDGCHACTQPLVASKVVNGSPSGLEHAIVEGCLMGHGNGMLAIRHREYHMEVLRGDNLLPAESNPLLAFLVLSLRAMAVTTAVVADLYLSAFRAYLHMTSKGAGSAHRHMAKRFSYRRNYIMGTKKLLSMVTYNLTDVEACPHCLGGKRTSISRTCLTGSMSAT